MVDTVCPRVASMIKQILYLSDDLSILLELLAVNVAIAFVESDLLPEFLAKSNCVAAIFIDLSTLNVVKSIDAGITFKFYQLVNTIQTFFYTIKNHCKNLTYTIYR